MSSSLSNQINISETQLYDNIIKKINNINKKLLTIKNYSSKLDTNKNIKYLEKFSLFSYKLNKLIVHINDMYDEYILGVNNNELNNKDKNKKNNLIIEKKIKNIFEPYMLYLQVILQNTN